MPGMKFCSQCGQARPLSEFYHLKNGSYNQPCKECARANARRKYRSDCMEGDFREKKRAQSAKYREAHRAELADAQRERRRKAGVPPKKRIDRAKLLKMYAEGATVAEIAEACGTTDNTVRQYAARTGIKRVRADRIQVCRNCCNYPCFEGIDTLSSNLADTCKSWHLRG